MDKVRDYFKGVYGFDALSLLLVLISLILDLISAFIPANLAKWFVIVSFLPIILAVLRIMSKNFEARRRENERFMSVLRPFVERKLREAPAKAQEKAQYKEAKKYYKFYKCPACTQKIRVPKGKGKIEITCPRCDLKFVRKT